MFWTYYFYSLVGVTCFLLLNLFAFQRSYPQKTGATRLLCWWKENMFFIIASLLFITAFTHIINVMEEPVKLEFVSFTFGKRAICLLSGMTIETLMNLARRYFKPISATPK